MAQNSLHDLADRVRQGDTTAAKEMRQVLAPNLARIARRAMRHGTENIFAPHPAHSGLGGAAGTRRPLAAGRRTGAADRTGRRSAH